MVEDTLDAWRGVFYITAGVSVGTAAFWFANAQGSVQPWAQVEVAVEKAEGLALEANAKAKTERH